VLGLDTSCGGAGNIRGLPTWNLDAQVVKNVGVYKERGGTHLFFTFTTVLSHLQASGGSLTLTSPSSFGQIGGGGSPRSMEFGLRVHF